MAAKNRLKWILKTPDIEKSGYTMINASDAELIEDINGLMYTLQHYKEIILKAEVLTTKAQLRGFISGSCLIDPNNTPTREGFNELREHDAPVLCPSCGSINIEPRKHRSGYYCTDCAAIIDDTSISTQSGGKITWD